MQKILLLLNRDSVIGKRNKKRATDSTLNSQLIQLCVFCLLPFAFSCCTYEIKIRDGKTAFERKQYAVASKFFEKEYTATTSRVEKNKIALQLSESYNQLHDYPKAETWFKKAYDGGAGIEALKQYAQTLKKSEHYKEAIETFKTLGAEIGSPYEFKKDIAACQIAQTWLNDTAYSGYRIFNAPFNSPQNDYAPALFEKDKIVFTSDRPSAKGEKNYNWTGKKFADLFVVETLHATSSNPDLHATSSNPDLHATSSNPDVHATSSNPDVHATSSNPETLHATSLPFDAALNSDFNEACATFTAAGDKVFFVKSGGEKDVDIQYTRIFYSNRINGTWTTPEVLSFCKDKVNYTAPHVTANGKMLYFSANDAEGWGGYDLYFCPLSNDGFTEPKLMPRSLNTIGNESYPFADGDTLYFASDYWQGMGGFDIFKSVHQKNGDWSTPENLKAPINSGADDFGLIIDKSIETLHATSPQKGYFTSNRLGGKGNDDIYAFERFTPPPRPAVVKLDTPKTAVPSKLIYKNTLDVYVLEKIYANPDNPNSKVLGRKPLLGSTIKLSTLNSSKLNAQSSKLFEVNQEGFININLEDNTDYSFIANKTDYLNNTAIFTSKGLTRDAANPEKTYEVEILLERIFKNKEITLENIYYDYDKWNIRDDAKPTLNELGNLLQNNPAIKIQLSSHTDCRGRDAYNLTLSQKRAESAVEYLISRGIETQRLRAQGYGETQPAVNCVCEKCTEEQHQSNRRTTFKILE